MSRKLFTNYSISILGILLLFTIVFLCAYPSHQTFAATLTVNSTADDDDGDCNGPSGDCTLREAIRYANNGDYITFSLAPGSVISITSYLPSLSVGNLTIDGDLDDDGKPDIMIRGVGLASLVSGLKVTSSGNTIEGLVISDFTSRGIYIDGSTAATDNIIRHCYIGTDFSGSSSLANSYSGIYITGGNAANNRIEDNLISGNGTSGIYLVGATNTFIVSNTIGLNITGTAVVANASSGIYISATLTTTIQANLISGNGANGVLITGGAANTIIKGNKIGTDITGTLDRGNGRDGIQIYGAHDTTIGGTTAAERNIISGNNRAGIFITNRTDKGPYESYNNFVYGNYIGTTADGTGDLGNGFGADDGDAGVQIQRGAHDNVIGGTVSGQGNLISYNMHGVRISGGDPLSTVLTSDPPQGNQVVGNTITHNDRYGVVSQLTHRNTTFLTPADGDNLIASNVITDNYKGGVYNIGASPRILSNTITHNGNPNDIGGIANFAYFGVDGPANADDDLLSMPYIAGNTIDANGNDGIFSRDTTPMNRYTLHLDNTIGDNSGDADISQRWFGAVEVLTGTATINSGIVVTITAPGGRNPCAGGVACVGKYYSQASSSPEQGIWGPQYISYTDVLIESTGGTTWFELLEYEVDASGQWITYTPHLIQVGGQYIGSTVFSFDGISITHPVTPDHQLPFCVNTGIITSSIGSLCRYQLAQVVVVDPNADDDNDGIPNDEEGSGDSDGDGTPDYLDTDSDNNGIPDSEEDDPWGDDDGDGTPNYQDADDDGDGIPDSEEGAADNRDSDGDGTPDYRDTDSDNDGIPDEEEAGPDPNNPVDTDGDGIPDYIESNTEDTDGDGTPNYQDTDSDGDGIPDDDEYYGGGGDDSFCSETVPDTDNDGIPNCQDNDVDGDGIPNYLDGDSDGDGIPDQQEGTDDSDGDGVPDWLDPEDGADTSQGGDSDDDGISDAEEYNDPGDPSDDFCTDTTLDSDGDGIPNCQDNDADGDGIPNYLDEDSDGDGIPDAEEGTGDDDNDGIPNYLDPVYRLFLPVIMKNR